MRVLFFLVLLMGCQEVERKPGMAYEDGGEVTPPSSGKGADNQNNDPYVPGANTGGGTQLQSTAYQKALALLTGDQACEQQYDCYQSPVAILSDSGSCTALAVRENVLENLGGLEFVRDFNRRQAAELQKAGNNNAVAQAQQCDFGYLGSAVCDTASKKCVVKK